MTPSIHTVQTLRSRTVEDANGCWVWQRCTDKDGYGKIQCGGRPKRGGCLAFAHRLMLEIVRGEALGDLKALHTCDNPPCINPDHLYAGTPLDNMRDKISRNRQGYVGLPGEKHHMASLTDDQARQILEIGHSKPANEVALMFGTTRPVVYAIRNRQSWKHITLPGHAPQYALKNGRV